TPADVETVSVTVQAERSATHTVTDCGVTFRSIGPANTGGIWPVCPTAMFIRSASLVKPMLYLTLRAVRLEGPAPNGSISALRSWKNARMGNSSFRKTWVTHPAFCEESKSALEGV